MAPPSPRDGGQRCPGVEERVAIRDDRSAEACAAGVRDDGPST
ncbi:hypothetical protein ABZ635_16270 [Nocardiopsis sp. NPDC007018]